MQRPRKPSPATLIALLALFVALSQSALATPVVHLARQIAGSKIKKNSITTKQVKNHTLKEIDVKANALGGAAIDESKLGQVPLAASVPDGAIGTSKLADGAVSGRKLPAVTVVKATSGSIADNDFETATAPCPTGQKAIGGGGQVVDAGDGVTPGGFLMFSRPNVSSDNTAPDTGGSFDSWRVAGFNPTGAPGTALADAWVFCIP
jgi:hypothetical protein